MTSKYQGPTGVGAGVAKKNEIDDAHARRFVARKFLQCAYGISCALEKLNAEFDRRLKKQASKGLPTTRALSDLSAANQAQQSDRRRRPRTDRWGQAKNLLKSLINEGYEPSCLEVAELVVAVLRSGFLPVLEEAWLRVALLQDVPENAETITRFWKQSVVVPLKSRYPKHFWPDHDSPQHGVESSQSVIPPSDVLRYCGQSDPRIEYVVWVRACELLAELIEQPRSDAFLRKDASQKRHRKRRSHRRGATKQVAPSPDQLVVDVEAHQARWGTDILAITALQDFRALAKLWANLGKVVSHSDLHRVIKPNETKPGDVHADALFSASQEERDVVNHIRHALRKVNAPYRIDSVKKVGYKLVRTTKNLTSNDVPPTSH